MIRAIMKDGAFLSLPSAPATSDNLPVAQDLLDTLTAHKDGCVGMAANMIGVSKRVMVYCLLSEWCVPTSFYQRGNVKNNAQINLQALGE